MGSDTLAVFLLHDVREVDGDGRLSSDPFYAIPAPAFERLVRDLVTGRHPTVLCRDIAAWQRGQGPARAVALTFDDGLASHAQVVLPVLQRYGCRATFFITAGALGQAGHLGSSDLRILHQAGMEIGSHGMSHRPLTRLTSQELAWELETSRRRLEAEIQGAVLSLAVPGGFVNHAVRDAAGRAGYQVLCSSRVGFNAIGAEDAEVRRLVVRRPLTTRAVLGLARGDRRYLWPRQLIAAGASTGRTLLGLGRYERLKRRVAAPMTGGRG